MKKLIGLLLLLGAVVAGGPFVSGILVEQRYQELLAEDAFENTVTLQNESYERGWFSSTIVTQVEVTEPQVAAAYAQYKTKADAAAGISSGDSRPMFRVESVIHHGPAWLEGGFGMGLARVDSRLILDDNERAEMSSVFEGEAISMQTMVHFGRSAEAKINIAKATITKSASGETVIFHPISSSWLVMDLGNRIKGEITWSGMDASGGKVDLHFSGAVIKTSMERHADLWVGDLSWDQDEWRFGELGKQVAFKGLHFDTDSGVNANGDLVEGLNVNMTLQSADVAGQEYGPGVYRMSISNLPVDTLVKIQKAQDEMARASASDPTGRAAVAASRQILMMLPELFSRGPVIEISELKVATPQGEVRGNLKISLPETAPEMLLNPQYLKQIIRADAELTVPAAYFSAPQAAQAAYNFTQSGLIEQRDGMLHSSLHMADGQLTVNSKPVPLPF